MIYDMSILYTRGEHNADSSVDLVGFLAKYSQWPVVTLGPNWCMIKHRIEVCVCVIICAYHIHNRFHVKIDN